MASELTLSGSLRYDDATSDEQALQLLELVANVSTLKYIKAKQTIGITEEAIALAENTAPGWVLFINRDPTNFIELRVATSGAKFAKLLHGEFCLLRLGSGAQAPYAIADTAPCVLEYLLIST